jgi:hypothetical protein
LLAVSEVLVAMFSIQNEDRRRRLDEIQRRMNKQTKTVQTRIDVGRSSESSFVDFPSLLAWTVEFVNIKEEVVTEFLGVFGSIVDG